jgi:hypothetical protein
MFYEDVFRAFGKKGLRYLVVGGIAVNLHGVPRATADLDIMIDLEEENIEKFVRAVKKLGFVPRVPVNPEDLRCREIREKWRKEKKMEVLTFWKPRRSLQEIDIFIKNPIDFKRAYKNREEIRAKDIIIPLASIDDLIKIKEKSGRKQDLADIEALKKLIELKK